MKLNKDPYGTSAILGSDTTPDPNYQLLDIADGALLYHQTCFLINNKTQK